MPVQTRAQKRDAEMNRETQDVPDSDSEEEDASTARLMLLKRHVLWHFAALAPETWLKSHIDEATPQTRQYSKTVSTILAYVHEDPKFGGTLLQGSEVSILQPSWTLAILKAMRDRLSFIKDQFGSVDVIDTANSLRRWEKGMKQISTALIAFKAVKTIKLPFADEILDALEFIIESDYDLRRHRTQPSYAASSQAQYNLYHNMIDDNNDDDDDNVHFCMKELDALVSGTGPSATGDKLAAIIRLSSQERNRRRLLTALWTVHQGI